MTTHPGPLVPEDVLALPLPAGVIGYELVDGVPVPVSPASLRHARVHLAVEVELSSGRKPGGMQRVRDYLEAGVALVWAIHPRRRAATVYRQDGSRTELGETDSLDGEDVVPGFRLPLEAARLKAVAGGAPAAHTSVRSSRVTPATSSARSSPYAVPGVRNPGGASPASTRRAMSSAARAVKR